MHNDFFLFLRLLSGVVFLGSIWVGFYMLKNYQKLFGKDPSMPSENESARAYSQVQIFCVWAHVFFATGAFALFLH
jgi:hypothetical protein